MMRMSVPLSSRWVAKLWRRVCTRHAALPGRPLRAPTGRRPAAWSTLTGRSPVAAGKEPVRRPGQPPVGPQDRQQLRRQHDVAVLAALALLDPDHHPAAVDVADLEA